MPSEPSQPPQPPQSEPDLDERTRSLCELRDRMTELHSQLEYLKLMLKLGVR